MGIKYLYLGWIRYYTSAIVYNYFACIVGTFSQIRKSSCLEAGPETGIWMPSVHGGTALKGKVVRDTR